MCAVYIKDSWKKGRMEGCEWAQRTLSAGVALPVCAGLLLCKHRICSVCVWPSCPLAITSVSHITHTHNESLVSHSSICPARCPYAKAASCLYTLLCAFCVRKVRGFHECNSQIGCFVISLKWYSYTIIFHVISVYSVLFSWERFQMDSLPKNNKFCGHLSLSSATKVEFEKCLCGFVSI